MRFLPLLLLLLACRPDPGRPFYPTPEPWVDTADAFFPGPDPYEDGDSRLSLGPFYEGEYSDFLPADNFYIYEETFAVYPTDDRVEGYSADIWQHLGKAWWGGGLHYDTAQDLSGWDTLHISLNSEELSLVEVALNGGAEARVNAADYGYTNDGEWHHLSIPMTAFTSGGANLAQVTVPLILIGAGGAEGDELIVDNLYLTAE
jgi:hypothetical protein